MEVQITAIKAEIRNVPPTWVHPEKDGKPIPLFNEYTYVHKCWTDGLNLWLDGKKWKGFDPRNGQMFNGGTETEPHGKESTREAWVQFCGSDEPQREKFMPEWPEHEATHCQCYAADHGVPLSPVLTPEEMERDLNQFKKNTEEQLLPAVLPVEVLEAAKREAQAS